MRPTERSQAIAFLLSFGAIPLGCPAEDDEDTGASTNPSGSNSNSSTASSTASSTDGTDSAGTDSDASATNPNPTLSTTTDPSSATLTTDPSDPSDPTVDPDTGYGTYGSSGYTQCEAASVPAGCMAYSAHYVKCFPKYAAYQEEITTYCACAITYYAPMYGAGCAAAYEDYFACLTALPCDNMDKAACAAEGMALGTACGGGESGGSDGG